MVAVSIAVVSIGGLSTAPTAAGRLLLSPDEVRAGGERAPLTSRRPPADLPPISRLSPRISQMNFEEMSGGSKAWKDVWGAGQGVGAIKKVSGAF